MKWIAVALLLCCHPGRADAQTVDGYASLMLDVLPHLRRGEAEARRAAELRSRVFADYRRDIGTRIHFAASGFVDGLIRDRREADVLGAAIVRPQELSLEGRWAHADLRVGLSRVVWGRLDEFLPTDVVNPQDLTRFFFEGRSEGRLPVAMIRARWLPSDSFAAEIVYVPVFRAGRYDQLDEESAPFNAGPPPAVELRRREPARAFRNAQGGVRASATTGRVDWSLSAYRGFEPLPLYQLRIGPTVSVDALFPRFTMIGGDFETVRGLWGVRGEVAVFVQRSIQAASEAAIVEGRAVEAGLGIDRKAGEYRVSGNIVLTTRSDRASDRETPGFSRGTRAIDRTDVTLVGIVDRSFARETRSIRAFAVYNPGEQSAFARVIGTISLRDNVSVEGSAGVFAGTGLDVLARLADRDFLYARFKVFF